ncbi:MAG: hypothetical protein OEZ03_11730, partial [Alphaproteobacteria bacterium]|nr:hypothetical protein [Alphaproteobacteria bacterium]
MTDRGMSRRTWLILRWAMIGALSGALASLLLFLVGPALSYLPVRQFLRLYIDFGPFKFWLDPGQFMSGLAFGLVTGSAFLHANLLSRKQLAVYVLGCILSFFAGGVIGLIPNMSGLVESRYLAAPLGGLAKAGLLMMVSGTLMPAFRRPRTIVLTIIVGGGLAAILIVPNLFFPDPFFFLKNREIGSLLRLAISTVWHAGIAAAMATVFDGRKWPDRDTGSAVDPDGFGFDFSQRARVIVRWTLIGLLSGVITAALIPLTKWSLFLLWVRDLPDIIGIAMLFLLVVPVWPGPVFGVVMGRALIRSGFLRPERYAGYVTIATLSYIAAGAATASLA